MEENLIGYLLNALDDESHRQVEEHLKKSSSARERLDLLRHSLEPLAFDVEVFEPPRDLVVNTLAKVAHAATQKPVAKMADTRSSTEPPASDPTQPTVISRPFAFMRRLDVLVAACLLLVVAGVASAWIYRLRVMNGRVLCQESLNEVYVGLQGYQGQHGHFPNVATVAKPPRNVAGLVVPMLIAKGYLPADFQVTCPSGLSAYPINFQVALRMNLKDFEESSARFTPCFGYSLGYRDAFGKTQPPGCSGLGPGESLVILMADGPPSELRNGNSLNHGGQGQNVLYIDGHAKFLNTRFAGFMGDDIYLNRRSRVAPGVDWQDSVIGHGGARP